MNHNLSLIERRRVLAALGGAGFAAFLAKNGSPLAAADSCVPSTPTVTEGPYWVDEKLFRSDIRTDPSTGTARAGVPLALTITLQNSSGGTCVPLTGAYVDIWHCDASGIYSDEPTYNPGGGTGTVTTTGQKFLRGYQIADENGQVQFTTIYPGWYAGRTIHIHVRVRTYSGSTLLGNFVTQLFFDESINNTVMAQAPYTRSTTRTTLNANDMVYTGAANASRMLVSLSKTDSGYAANITLGVSLQTPAAALPAIDAGGIANAASGGAGLAPGSWIAIYGTNLSTTTRAMAESDLVNGSMPTTLAGVSVQINGRAAYMDYVSPTLIIVLSPADAISGSVSVTVTNAAGTSAPATAVLQSILPGLFVLSNYVRAVRWPDGVIINGTGAAEGSYSTAAAAKPGDILELYGTGLGPTTAAVDSGLMFSGAYENQNPVTVMIGGAPAQVLWAGLVGPGLWLINTVVPTGLANGDRTIVAAVGGYTTQSTAVLKIANS